MPAAAHVPTARRLWRLRLGAPTRVEPHIDAPRPFGVLRVRSAVRLGQLAPVSRWRRRQKL